MCLDSFARTRYTTKIVPLKKGSHICPKKKTSCSQHFPSLAATPGQMSSGSLILALGDGARSTVVSSFQISRSRRWIQSEIRGEFSLFSSPVLYRYLPLAPLFNMKKTTWCCLIDFHLFTTVFDLWSPRARVCTDRCSCCNLVQDLIAVWVVDYIGGGTRHMSPEELDCTAMEPSHVSVGSGRKDSIEIPHVQRHKRERKWFCLSVERVSTLS